MDGLETVGTREVALLSVCQRSNSLDVFRTGQRLTCPLVENKDEKSKKLSKTVTLIFFIGVSLGYFRPAVSCLF